MKRLILYEDDKYISHIKDWKPGYKGQYVYVNEKGTTLQYRLIGIVEHPYAFKVIHTLGYDNRTNWNYVIDDINTGYERIFGASDEVYLISKKEKDMLML